MNAVIGMSRMLMESDLPPDLYECAETIESSGAEIYIEFDYACSKLPWLLTQETT